MTINCRSRDILSFCRRTCQVDDEWRVYPAVVSISLSRTEACLALCECMAANHSVFWLSAPDVQQMGFTNITPGCTGFYSGLLCLCHSCRFSQCSFLSCITCYVVVFLKKYPFLTSPLYLRFSFVLRCFLKMESGQRGREVFSCWIGWSLPPFLIARQAPVFHLKRLWIYAANCSHLSSVNHLGLGAPAPHVPRPIDDPQGKSNGSQPSLTLLKYFLGTTLRENRTAK